MGDEARSAWADRLLSCTGSDPAPIAASKLRAFRRFLLLLTAAEAWHALHYPAYREDPALHLAIAGWTSAWALVGQWRRYERVAAAAAAAAIALDLASVFPQNANHQYLGLVAMTLLALSANQESEAIPVTQALRWIVPIGFFWAGVQKLLWGYWFGGEFLAVRIATDPHFAEVFAHFLSPEEHARLTALLPGRGVGPYRVSEPLFLAVSNGTWLAEIGLAPLLLIARTRRMAALGVVLFMIAIESAAREIFFGMLMFSLALLYTRGDASSRALPWLAAALALLLATSAGLLPHWSFG